MKNFRSALLLLLTISYLSGSKIVEFSSYYQRYFNLLYMLLFWTVYYFLLRYTVMAYINVYATTLYLICFYTDISTALLSIAVGVYRNKVRQSRYYSLSNKQFWLYFKINKALVSVEIIKFLIFITSCI